MKEIRPERSKKDSADSEITLPDFMYWSENLGAFEVDFSKGRQGGIIVDKRNEKTHMFYPDNFIKGKIWQDKLDRIKHDFSIERIMTDKMECEEIVEHVVEILAEWSEITDIKAQIQYGAVIVSKIEKIKKNAWIQSNDSKKKICTLLWNIIRLNITEELFSAQQICLLKQGFELLVCDEVGKENLLQLNRKFRKENLMTMPAWE